MKNSRHFQLKAAHWYAQGAAAGEPVSMYNLARCYNLGQGVPKDESLCIHWFKEAAAKNDAPAKEALAQIQDAQDAQDGQALNPLANVMLTSIMDGLRDSVEPTDNSQEDARERAVAANEMARERELQGEEDRASNAAAWDKWTRNSFNTPSEGSSP